MHTYEECLRVVRELPEFKQVYACVEDAGNYYFMIRIAADNPFYQVSKKNLSYTVVPGLQLQKKKDKLKRVK